MEIAEFIYMLLHCHNYLKACHNIVGHFHAEVINNSCLYGQKNTREEKVLEVGLESED